MEVKNPFDYIVLSLTNFQMELPEEVLLQGKSETWFEGHPAETCDRINHTGNSTIKKAHVFWNFIPSSSNLNNLLDWSFGKVKARIEMKEFKNIKDYEPELCHDLRWIPNTSRNCFD